MDKITAQQAAKKWNISIRTVQNLCNHGRISGAERWGRSWMIPQDAIKPVDNRTKAAKLNTDNSPYLQMPDSSPLLLMTDIYNEPGSISKCVESLPGNAQTAILLDGWISYSRGETERACELAKSLFTVRGDFYSTISVGILLSTCALWEGDISLWSKGRKHILKAKCQSENDYKLRQFWHTTTDVSFHDISVFLEWFRIGCFEELPFASLPAAWFYYAKSLSICAKKLATGKIQISEVQGLGLLRTFPYLVEPMVTQAKLAKAILAESYLRLLCAEAYNDLGDKENAIRHIDAALALILPDRLYGVLAEFRGVLNNLLDERVALFEPSAVKSIKDLQKQAMSGFAKINKELPQVPILNTLSTRECEVARLAAFGLSNTEIADRLHISVSSVKSIVSMIMNKTGAQKRSEFVDYIV